MDLPGPDLDRLIALRHDLHRAPEVSGAEAGTAAQIAAFLETCGPQQIVTGLGGHGVLAEFPGALPGPTLLLRCELDALPILEAGAPAWRSIRPGTAHLCGHDGHMAILSGVALQLARTPPARGRVVLLFQPAEEDGAGAARVIDDPAFAPFTPDMALALHNYPGLPLGHAVARAGAANCASRGVKIALKGREAHASSPETGRSPAPALSRLLTLLPGLGNARPVTDPGFVRLTVTHASLGAQSFGIAPGSAELWATLRTRSDVQMEGLVSAFEALAQTEASAAGLGLSFDYTDIFTHCENAPEAAALLARAAAKAGLIEGEMDLPMRASEDFGRFGALAPAAMLFLGAGETCPALHDPDYDFPDALIGPGVALFTHAVRDYLG